MKVAARRRAGVAAGAFVLLAALAATGVLTSAPAKAAPGDFTVTPTTLSFPDTYVNATSSIAVVITNVSGVSQTPSYAGGAPADPTNFGGSQNCAGVTLAPNASCAFTYTFNPTTSGAKSSNTTI